ncbi:uncharacterized protein LOC116286605 [Actinia tenebrosa]|uniref:Uncharacterized protein LOC116286605 n=1 Tax=Actinia tenebrosa TaxID=6105 RepID=A0A6P8H8E4_ACTTE|nr:uncharacterized protein LOC116286605 [Actinia tenebrosa]
MEFPSFLTPFESLIESKVEDSVERLYFLGQYTTGTAKEVISGCLQRKTDDAYDEAKNLLQRQFGDPFKIASAHINRLSSWPQIKPNEGLALQDFALALEQAKSAMKGMSHMDDLNTAQVLRQSWEKLPRHLRSKWAERNSKTRSMKGRMADFEEFTQFVREQAELATDPVFSEEGVTKLPLEDKDKPTRPTFGRRPPKRVKGSSFATNLTERNNDRRDFVKEKELCYGCFSNQHVAKNCKDRLLCKTCSKKHPTSMHDDDWTSKTKNQSEKSQPKETPRVSNKRMDVCSVTEAGDIPVNLSVLPVWLSHESNPSNRLKVYALLDNASGGTFVKELAQKMGIEGSETELLLTTLQGTETELSKAINGLIVTNLMNEDVSLELPRTFTMQVIPADRSEIPIPDIVGQIDHLREVSKEIPPYMEEVEVGLLIGLNCPSALRPRDVVYGKETEPYAVRSLLGWYINGPINSSKCNSLHCNRILLDKQMASTTAKSYVVAQRTKGTAMSREDWKFYQTVEDWIVHLEDSHYEMPLPLKDRNIKLPNNRVQAEKRLESLKKRLKSDNKYHTDYCNFMSEIIFKGYARKVDTNLETKEGKF